MVIKVYNSKKSNNIIFIVIMVIKVYNSKKSNNSNIYSNNGNKSL